MNGVVPPTFALFTLTDFLAYLYQYKQEGGFWGGVALRIGNVCVVPVIAYLAVMLIGFMQWDSLLQCYSDASTCGTLMSYIDTWSSGWTNRKVLAASQIVAVSLWWIGLVGFFPSYVSRQKKLCAYFDSVLGLSDWSIVNGSWSAITHRIGVVTGVSQTHLNAAMMRRDNYWVAIHNLGLLKHWRCGGLQLQNTTLLRWTLNICLLDSTLSKDFLLTCSFSDVATFRRRLRLSAVCMLILLPCLLPFIVVYMLFRKAEEWHAHKTALLRRSLCEHAKWLYREFNEPEEEFDGRMQRVTSTMDTYLQTLKRPVMKSIASTLHMVTGFVLGVLLCIALVDEGIMLHVSLWNHNLLWIAGILSCVSVGIRAVLDTTPAEHRQVEELVQLLRSHTHHYQYYATADTNHVERLVQAHYPLLAKVLLCELWASICIPFFLLFRANGAVILDLHTRLQRITRGDKAFGGMCVFSAFDVIDVHHDFLEHDDVMVDARLNCMDLDLGVMKMRRSIVYNHLIYKEPMVLIGAETMFLKAIERETKSRGSWLWTKVTNAVLDKHEYATAVFYWIDQTSEEDDDELY